MERLRSSSSVMSGEKGADPRLAEIRALQELENELQNLTTLMAEKSAIEQLSMGKQASLHMSTIFAKRKTDDII